MIRKITQDPGLETKPGAPKISHPQLLTPGHLPPSTLFWSASVQELPCSVEGFDRLGIRHPGPPGQIDAGEMITERT